MSHTYTPNLLSDSLERAYLHASLDESKPLSLQKGVRKVGRLLARGTRAFGRGVVVAINAHAEARARNMLYNRAPW
ncbi:hypothetical protein ABS755_09845 [Castellaniella sp. FW104-16D08]|uniref:hypothetical protein n=1 Tax=unclassified Castellaniella TaxID=2617606 RepID=UPI0033160349